MVEFRRRATRGDQEYFSDQDQSLGQLIRPAESTRAIWIKASIAFGF